MDLIIKVIPPMSHERRMRAARRALEYAASLGVTSVQHMNPDFADVAVYSELAEKGDLTTRIYAVPMDDELDEHGEDRPSPRLGDRPGCAWERSKGYADGSLGSGYGLYVRTVRG